MELGCCSTSSVVGVGGGSSGVLSISKALLDVSALGGTELPSPCD
jgi:hypothetical protein